MTTVIWKAKLEQREVQDIEMPVNAVPLCVREQGDDICLWFICDPSTNDKQQYRVVLVATGFEAKVEGARYLGTAMLLGGAFVLHAFGA